MFIVLSAVFSGVLRYVVPLMSNLYGVSFARNTSFQGEHFFMKFGL